jgi:hypothetical protein
MATANTLLNELLGPELSRAFRGLIAESNRWERQQRATKRAAAHAAKVLKLGNLNEEYESLFEVREEVREELAETINPKVRRLLAAEFNDLGQEMAVVKGQIINIMKGK